MKIRVYLQEFDHGMNDKETSQIHKHFPAMLESGKKQTNRNKKN